MLKDVGLGARYADIGGRVGSRLHGKCHAEFLAGFLHDRDSAAHGLIGHMTREGNVHEGVAAELVSRADHQVSAGDKVVVDDEIRGGADLGKILVGLTGDADDVRSLLLDLAEGLGRAGDRLIHDDRLHLRIIGEVHDGLDGRLELLREVVGIDGKCDLVLAVLLLECLGASSVVLGLGHGTGDNADVEVFIRSGFLSPGRSGLSRRFSRGLSHRLSFRRLDGGAALSASAGCERNRERRAEEHA